MSALNDFERVRPRGPDLDIPAKPARKKAGHGVPMTVMPERMALDRNGRPVVGLGPRTTNQIHNIEGQVESQANRNKRRRIARGAD